MAEDPVDELDIPPPGNPIQDARENLERALHREGLHGVQRIMRSIDNLIQAHLDARPSPEGTEPERIGICCGHVHTRRYCGHESPNGDTCICDEPSYPDP